jgi:hypothetical protein
MDELTREHQISNNTIFFKRVNSKFNFEEGFIGLLPAKDKRQIEIRIMCREDNDNISVAGMTVSMNDFERICDTGLYYCNKGRFQNLNELK